MENVTPDGEELDDWYWTDEAWFHLNGYVNAQNMCIWSHENPHTLHEVPFHSQKVGVWTTVSQKHLFLSFFEERVKSDRYMLLVQKFLTTLTDDEWERLGSGRTKAQHTQSRTPWHSWKTCSMEG
jgi:hypothetical protein